jgi:DNA-binding CsgD family transcriptional regulator
LRQSILGFVLDALGDAAFLLQRDGSVVYANSSGRALLDSVDALRLRDGRVEAVDPMSRQVIAKMIVSAGLPGETGAASLRTNSGGRLNITMTGADVTGGVLMLAACVRRDDNRTTAQLTEAFGLTRAEADVAQAISAGDAPADIALARGASLATVKAQIKSVASKLDCRRQSEIAAVVQSMPCLR